MRRLRIRLTAWAVRARRLRWPQRSMARKTAPSAMPARAIQASSAATGTADQQHLGAKVGVGGLGAAEFDQQARQCRAVRGAGIGRHRILFDQLLEAQRRHLAAAAAAGGEGGEQQGAVAAVGQAAGAAGRKHRGEDVGGDRLFALAPARPGGGAHGEPDSTFEAGGVEGAGEPAPAGQRRPARQLAPDGRRRGRGLVPVRNTLRAVSSAITRSGMPWPGSLARSTGSHR